MITAMIQTSLHRLSAAGVILMALFAGAVLNLGVARAAPTVLVGLINSASSHTVVAGQSVTFTLEVENHNANALTNVRTCDRLAPRLIFIRATPASRLSDGRHCWTAAKLASGKTLTYKLTAQAPLGAGGRATNLATATADGASVTHSATTIDITAKAPVACPAAVRRGPTAHAAC